MPKGKNDTRPRVNVVIGHAVAERINEVRELKGLPTVPEAVRYLVARGLEEFDRERKGGPPGG